MSLAVEKKRGAVKNGVLIGGAGLVGGELTHYFTKLKESGIKLHAPNSKRLSIRNKEDIREYFLQKRPDFIVNTAIAPIGSDPELALEVNYIGAINLARVALAFGIPYIHISSAATLQMGEQVTESQQVKLSSRLSNYRKSKLLAELTLAEMGQQQGLDYTIVRLGIVYGKYDQKIQGFQRLLFSLAGQSMPFLFTKRDVYHSYSSNRKLPPFMAYLIKHRSRCRGASYNFVDPEPVELSHLILTIKSLLGVDTPRELYVPYQVCRMGREIMHWLTGKLSRIGVEVRLPAELMFLKSFYQTQTLDRRQFEACGYVEPAGRGETIFSVLPDLIQFYLTHWEHLNLILNYNRDFYSCREQAETFLRTPEQLLNKIHQQPPMTADRQLQDLL